MSAAGPAAAPVVPAAGPLLLLGYLRAGYAPLYGL
jgi:hypothetical protein